MKNKYEVSYKKLKMTYNPELFEFETKKKLEPISTGIGQERGIKALEFGLSVDVKGYNLYVEGPSGVGKTMYTKNYLKKVAKKRRVPHDWCYIYNFDNPNEPIAVDLPAGQGKEFKDSMDGFIKEIKKDIRSTFNNDDFEREKSLIRKQYEEKREDLSDLSKEIVEYKQKFKHLQGELVRLNKFDEQLEGKENISDKLGDLIVEIADKKSAREAFKEEHDAYIQAQGALDALGSETDAQLNLKRVKNEIDVQVTIIKDIIEQDPHLSSEISEEELENRINDLKQKNEEYNQYKGFIQNKQSFLSQMDSINDDIGMSINQIDIIENKIEASAFNQEKYDQILSSYEKYDGRRESFSSELSEIKGEARESIKVLNDLTDKITAASKFEQEYNDISDYINLLSHIRNLYSKNGIQKDLRNISRPMIQKHTKEYFKEFNFNYSDLTIDDEYDVTVYGPEGESSMTMVSGGEKIAIALALRLGITQAMSKGDLDTILLDEPTIHLDSSRRHELINLLKEMSLLPQMIIVTHESQLENAADNLIKVEKENGISKVIM